ncbi:MULTISPECIES: methyl-accepting chemotaxis protein [Halomonadaceae]|uniref:HAMP domain-containing protein n=1 Tax=Vreelandella halophila TaxID=86177 RepID=A0A9X5B569_9GAMM|nr:MULTISPECIES: methyl-accepting chemotaxis protein [Halomonas]MYL26113.1 HAMP domain-containing protein [Halomonas utahensis]MYL73325.1 HAMP domain-containing protein [Halomonas sp. 22501_18_FS]
MLALMRRFTIRQRLMGLVGVAFLLLLGIVLMVANDFEEGLYNSSKERTKNLVQSTMKVVEYYYERQQDGELSESQAKRRAAEAARNLRYGDDDYFWIHNMDTVMVMHPFSEDLEGESLKDYEDPNGVRLFAEMNKTIRNEGGSGFVPYHWPKPGFDDPVRKISYVQRFEPWDWVIGTGIYLDEQEAQYAAAMSGVITLAVIGILVLIGVSFLIVRSVTQPMGAAAAAMESIATGEGDLTRRLDDSGGDEVARVANGFNSFVSRIQDMVRELREVVGTNKEVAGSVRNSVTEAGQSFDQQKSELDTVASAIEEMTQTVDDVAKRISEAADAASTANDRASEGEHTAQEARDRMANLVQEVQQSSDAIGKLDEHAQNIGQVLDVIHGVADQTNLLALNAAIEAARAGEHGRGFAVVADEVRNLASRTQQSTDEIREMINQLQEGTRHAVETMQRSSEQTQSMQTSVDSARQALEAIAGSVSTITDMTQHVATSAEEQSQASNEISASLNHLTTLAGQVREELNSIQEQSQSLGSAADSIESMVRQFRVD